MSARESFHRTEHESKFRFYRRITTDINSGRFKCSNSKMRAAQVPSIALYFPACIAAFKPFTHAQIPHQCRSLSDVPADRMGPNAARAWHAQNATARYGSMVFSYGVAPDSGSSPCVDGRP